MLSRAIPSTGLRKATIRGVPIQSGALEHLMRQLGWGVGFAHPNKNHLFRMFGRAGSHCTSNTGHSNSSSASGKLFPSSKELSAGRMRIHSSWVRTMFANSLLSACTSQR